MKLILSHTLGDERKSPNLLIKVSMFFNYCVNSDIIHWSFFHYYWTYYPRVSRYILFCLNFLGFLNFSTIKIFLQLFHFYYQINKLQFFSNTCRRTLILRKFQTYYISQFWILCVNRIWSMIPEIFPKDFLVKH